MKTILFSLIISIITSSLISPALASKSPEVTIHNYVRAETDVQMQTYVKKFDCFGKFFHVREAYDVTSTDTIRPNLDTIYSWGVFDVTSPLTVELPDPGDRPAPLSRESGYTADPSPFATPGPGLENVRAKSACQARPQSCPLPPTTPPPHSTEAPRAVAVAACALPRPRVVSRWLSTVMRTAVGRSGVLWMLG